MPEKKAKARKGEVDPAMLRRQMENLTAKLLAEHTMDSLRQLHRNAFGTEYRGTDKGKLAAKIAVYTVTGEKPGDANGTTAPQKKQANPPAVSANPPAVSATPTKREEKMATVVLEKVRSAWDEVEVLTEERKTKLAEFRLLISEAKSAIAMTLADGELDELKRLAKIEGYWQTMSRTEQKKAEVGQEYQKLIRAAKQTVKHEMDNARQLPLFS